MNLAELSKWWQEAQANAVPQQGARAVLDYVTQEGEADLDALREVLTDHGVGPALHLGILSSMVDQGYLTEQDGPHGLSYTPGAGAAAPATPPEEEEDERPFDWSALSEADWASFAVGEWQPHRIERGPRKGTNVWKNLRTGAISDEDPARKKQEHERSALPRERERLAGGPAPGKVGRPVPTAPKEEGQPEPGSTRARSSLPGGLFGRLEVTPKEAGTEEPAAKAPERPRAPGSTRGSAAATGKAHAAWKARVDQLQEEHARAVAAHETAHAAWAAEAARQQEAYGQAHDAWEAREERRGELADLAREDVASLVEELVPQAGSLDTLRQAVPRTDAAGPAGREAARAEAEAYAARAVSSFEEAYGPGGALARGLAGAGLSEEELAPVLAVAGKGSAGLATTGKRYLAVVGRYLDARQKREEQEAREPPEPGDLPDPDPDDAAAVAAYDQEFERRDQEYTAWQERLDALTEREDQLATHAEELQDGLDDEWVEHEERVTTVLERVQRALGKRVEAEERADREPEEPPEPPEPEEPEEPEPPEEPEEEEEPMAHPHSEGTPVPFAEGPPATRHTDAMFSDDEMLQMFSSYWTPCRSSHVAQARYHAEDERLEVEFLDGTRGHYPSISADLAEDFGNAPSKGGWIADYMVPSKWPFIRD